MSRMIYICLLGAAAQTVSEHVVATPGDGKGGDANAALASSGRLPRLGDINPHPETKPARPDPIDMDEDEIEMSQVSKRTMESSFCFTQGYSKKKTN